jgi:hypothetical protein
MTRKIILLFLFSFLFKYSFAQEYLFPLNRDMEIRIEPYLQSDTGNFHSALKPFTMGELRKISPVDSVFTPIVEETKFTQTWLGRKIFKEHFLDVNTDDIHLSVDPIFNFQGGRELINNTNEYVNTRGILVQADVNQKFFFYTGFTENRSQFINYVNDFVNSTNVAPGQGRVKKVSDNVYDFSNARGGIAYTLNRHFDFLLAYDKNFVGDGYRSLLLSDNAYSYPFLRLNMTFWKFKYSAIYAVFQDHITGFDNDSGYAKKFGRFNYLDLNIGKKNRVSVGIFEGVISVQDANRSFDLNYINPVIFLRPVEYSIGSPDNELLGLNMKIKINANNVLYGQLLLDEFVLKEVKSGNGWWGNKQALQGGFKSFNIFKVKSLNVQSELNYVRPYTYQHRLNGPNYSEYNQALAHPLGANFIESVSFINYRWKNLFVEGKFIYSEIGLDRPFENDGNDGNNIYNDYAYHGPDYGHYTLDGIHTKLIYKDLRVNYLINPKTNLNVELGISDRTYSNTYGNIDSRLVYFGFRTSLENYYFDF